MADHSVDPVLSKPFQHQRAAKRRLEIEKQEKEDLEVDEVGTAGTMDFTPPENLEDEGNVEEDQANRSSYKNRSRDVDHPDLP